MLPDDVSNFLRSTYSKDIFSYKGAALSEIGSWLDKNKPDSIVQFKNILKLIKEDELKKDDKKLSRRDTNQANKDCWGIPFKTGNGKYILVFYQKIYNNDTRPPKITKYIIYQFKKNSKIKHNSSTDSV